MKKYMRKLMQSPERISEGLGVRLLQSRVYGPVVVLLSTLGLVASLVGAMLAFALLVLVGLSIEARLALGWWR